MAKSKKQTSKPKQQATAEVVRAVGKKGVVLTFIGSSPTKPDLRRGARLTVRGVVRCHGRLFLRVEGTLAGKPAVFHVAPTAVQRAAK